MARSCVVIGGGLGGLATAIRMRHAGWNVTIFEKNDRLGGRCNVFSEDGYTFDTGPTLLLMRDVLDDLFQSVGRDLREYLQLVRVQPNYRVHFADGTSIEFSADRDRMADELNAIESGASDAFERYLDDAGYKYRVARARFVERNFLHWYDFATPRNLYYLLTTNTLRKLDRHASRYFKDPRLVAASTFQTMYLGLAPHQAPAVYSLLPYTEIAEGIWFPCGGMYRLVGALEALARELGVQIRTHASVTHFHLDDRRVSAVVVGSDEYVAADAVVANADLPYVYRSLLPDRVQSRAGKWRRDHMNFGSSAFLLYLGLDREYPQLNHHDVFLSSDIEGNFDAIFKRFELPADPSFYICAASRTDRSLAPEGGEALYVLVPVPRVSDRVNWERERESFRNLVLDRLEKAGLEDLRAHIVLERTFTPDDFVDEYNIVKGSAFGISHGFTQVGYMRPSNKAQGLDNLYFVGASTQPGGGIPMVVIGSQLTAERVLHDA